MASKLETDFQRMVVRKLRNAFRSRIIVTKTDPGSVQGIPDLVVICGARYALLEVKRSAKAPKRPNQDYYITTFGQYSFTSFIYPENEKEVISNMCKWFGLDYRLYLAEK